MTSRKFLFDTFM